MKIWKYCLISFSVGLALTLFLGLKKTSPPNGLVPCDLMAKVDKNGGDRLTSGGCAPAIQTTNFPCKDASTNLLRVCINDNYYTYARGLPYHFLLHSVSGKNKIETHYFAYNVLILSLVAPFLWLVFYLNKYWVKIAPIKLNG